MASIMLYIVIAVIIISALSVLYAIITHSEPFLKIGGKKRKHKKNKKHT